MHTAPFKFMAGLSRRALRLLGSTLCLATLSVQTPSFAVDLANQPIFSSSSLPAAMMLVMSVEYPTADSTANTVAYTTATEFPGYWNPGYCYTYTYDSTSDTASPPTANSYFYPTATASSHVCSSKWSGNFLNWLALQTIDPFRWALTGGYRVTDSSSTTVLEKAWADGQGGSGESKTRMIIGTDVSNSTPLSWAAFTGRVWGAGNRIVFTGITCNDSSSTSAPALGSTASTAVIAFLDSYSVTANNPPTYSAPSSYGTNCTKTPSSPTSPPSVTAYDGTSGISANAVYTMAARVRVCDGTTGSPGRESNCVGYPSSTPTVYKPEGLLQQYSGIIKYGVVSYLNDSSGTRDAGVLRSRVKWIAPTQPNIGAASSTNAYTEWSSTDGTQGANPNLDDGSAASVTNADVAIAASNSGVMNYVNKFGELSRKNGSTYKGNDPVSELYYAGIRYFKHKGNVSDWSSSVTSSTADSFPVILNWYTSTVGGVTTTNDPIQYSCQKNFFLGIGDVNTHKDENLPGSNWPGPISGQEPQIPASVSADSPLQTTTQTAANVTTLTNAIGTIEGSNSNLGTTHTGDNATYYIAGLAYDAHVNDMRPDITVNPDGSAKTGNITAATYWLDVQEYQAYVSSNQYYYATKYGGFNIPAGWTSLTTASQKSTYPGLNTSSGANQTLWHTNTDCLKGDQTKATPNTNTTCPSGSQARPDNYYSAGDANSMVSGLKSAFASIAYATTRSSNSFSTSSAAVPVGNMAYGDTSSPGDYWSGTVVGYSVTYVSNAPVTSASPIWDAGSIMAANNASGGWNSGRYIVTCCSASATVPGEAFRTASLTSAQLLLLGTTSTTQGNVLNYLRGDTSNQGSNGSGYRIRSTKYGFGDINNSLLAAVGPPTTTLSETNNPGHSAFATTYASRKTVIYFGANDGMMHAVDGSSTSVSSGGTGGKELFAYIPSALYAGPSSPSTPSVDGLLALTTSSFQGSHRNFVDATPVIHDVDFTNTSGSTPCTTPSGSTNNCDWRTMLVGGLGSGGKGYYALDVSNPAGFTSETTVAAKVLWEFNGDVLNVGRMGFSFGPANIVKTKKYGWVVIVTSGYNNTDGNGYFFFLNPKTGALLETVMAGTTTDQATGMTFATAYGVDYSDLTVDSIYAGDLNGNVWRLNLTATSGAYPAPVKIATVKDSSGNAQPVTTGVLVEQYPFNNFRYVLVGTGKLLAQSDISSSAVQSIYVFNDGSATTGGFYGGTSTLPTGLTYPITRSQMNPLTSLVNGLPTSAALLGGWYYDLPVSAVSSTSNIAYRISVNPTASVGIAYFAANLPNGQVCTPSGSHLDYAFDFVSGQTVLLNSSGVLTESWSGSGATTEIVLTTQNGETRAVFENDTGSAESPTRQSFGSRPFQRVNWREVPTQD